MNPSAEPTQTTTEAAVERLAPPLPASAWEQARAEFGAHAGDAALIDVAVERHETPYGPMLVAATGDGLVRVALPAEDEDAVLDRLAARISPRVLIAPREVTTQARRELDEYFGGRREQFTIPLDWRLTAGFRREVLRATAAIPYGATASYAAMATAAGSPRAVRAAGTALATNPLPIVVPCHRVLRSDGVVGAYLGGSAMKTALLQSEGALSVG